jgi:hypothetical protein
MIPVAIPEAGLMAIKIRDVLGAKKGLMPISALRAYKSLILSGQ